MPRHPNPFGSYCEPSRRVTRRRYPEEWAWWRASGWHFLLEDKEDGSLRLHTLREQGASTSLWGAHISADEANRPEEVRLFLTEALYLHLHPRKARAALAATGQVCNQAEFSAFIRAQRRKVGKLKP